MKQTDVRRAVGWMKTHSKQFDSEVLLADATADALGLYENETQVPNELLDLAKKVMNHSI